MINIEIITIGDELLIGQVIDTNSAWMAQELSKYGFDVKYKSTVGDSEKDILDAFERAFSRASVVLVTGGIGPTRDDITRKTLCNFFNTALVFDEKVLQNIECIFQNANIALNELTRNQAYVPESATIIQNKMGTAPITWFEKGGKVLVSMPGVPYEMKDAMLKEIIPRLRHSFNQSSTIIHQSYWVNGYSESRLAIHLEQFENELPEYIKLAYLPSLGLIRLRLTGKHQEQAFIETQIKEQDQLLANLLGENLVSKEDKPMEVLLSELLRKKGLSLSVAESCTGGRIASLITAIPGSSAFFKGGVVSYSNEAKSEVLKVNKCDIDDYGAVSETVVQQMADGVRELFHTDCSIATSGIAGPDGGTEEKPVGTVWISVSFKELTETRKYVFSKNRENNILRSSSTAMLMLYNLINKKQA